jgi:hypothetical protein
MLPIMVELPKVLSKTYIGNSNFFRTSILVLKFITFNASNYEKNYFTFHLFFLCKGFQSNGITYQAVILKPTNKISATSENLPVANKNVCMQFQFIDEFSKIEYPNYNRSIQDGKSCYYRYSNGDMQHLLTI